MKMPEIFCAQCGRPVDKVTTWKCDYKATLWVQVECHGEVDTCELTSQFIMSAPALGSMSATAFRNERLLGGGA